MLFSQVSSFYSLGAYYSIWIVKFARFGCVVYYLLCSEICNRGEAHSAPLPGSVKVLSPFLHEEMKYMITLLSRQRPALPE